MNIRNAVLKGKPFSQHSGREGEAPQALLVEGETRAPKMAGL